MATVVTGLTGPRPHRQLRPPMQLSLDAQILAVSDMMDALAARQPYRAGMPSDRVLGILREGAGAQFSSACVSACTVDLIERDAA